MSRIMRVAQSLIHLTNKIDFCPLSVLQVLTVLNLSQPENFDFEPPLPPPLSTPLKI